MSILSKIWTFWFPGWLKETQEEYVFRNEGKIQLANSGYANTTIPTPETGFSDPVYVEANTGAPLVDGDQTWRTWPEDAPVSSDVKDANTNWVPQDNCTIAPDGPVEEPVKEWEGSFTDTVPQYDWDPEEIRKAAEAAETGSTIDVPSEAVYSDPLIEAFDKVADPDATIITNEPPDVAELAPVTVAPPVVAEEAPKKKRKRNRKPKKTKA
jgi:hypothetical protein